MLTAATWTAICEAGAWVCAAAALLPAYRQFLIKHNMLAANYRGCRIPTGFGLYFWLLALLHGIVQCWTSPDKSGSAITVSYIGALAVVLMVGWADDKWGDDSAKGIKGHLRQSLREGRMTTGMGKACGITLASAFMSGVIADNWRETVFGTLVIMLATNTVNLLDLRPGRALKTYFLFVGCLLSCTAMPGLAWGWGLPAVAGGACLLFGDLRARWMLGDSGANVLGFSLGVAYMLWAPGWMQWLALAVFAALHWCAERASLTRYIESSRFLYWLDRWGRPGDDRGQVRN